MLFLVWLFAPHVFGVFLAKSQRAQGGVLNLDTWDSFDF